MSPEQARKPKVIAIVGPTCTGKTALSISLCRDIGGEVIGCDSRTIYKYMDIGTAKPTIEERGGIPHHMFDVVAPDEPYTVAQYAEAAAAVIANLHDRGKTPVVVGGTGLYARALLEGLSIPAVPPQIELRASLQQLADSEGNTRLHERLRELDPVTADRLNPNDRFRVIRAIEVTMTAKQPFSTLTAKTEPPYETMWIGLTVSDRDYLKRAIAQRMDAQLQQGLVDEVQTLYQKYGPVRALMKAVNYCEFIDFFEDRIAYKDAIEGCIRHNYQLARRQLMWFKTNVAINWLEIDRTSAAEIFSSARRCIAGDPE